MRELRARKHRESNVAVLLAKFARSNRKFDTKFATALEQTALDDDQYKNELRSDGQDPPNGVPTVPLNGEGTHASAPEDLL